MPPYSAGREHGPYESRCCGMGCAAPGRHWLPSAGCEQGAISVRCSALGEGGSEHAELGGTRSWWSSSAAGLLQGWGCPWGGQVRAKLGRREAFSAPDKLQGAGNSHSSQIAGKWAVIAF